jgi:hypothetical protein
MASVSDRHSSFPHKQTALSSDMIRRPHQSRWDSDEKRGIRFFTLSRGTHPSGATNLSEPSPRHRSWRVEAWLEDSFVMRVKFVWQDIYFLMSYSMDYHRSSHHDMEPRKWGCVCKGRSKAAVARVKKTVQFHRRHSPTWATPAPCCPALLSSTSDLLQVFGSTVSWVHGRTVGEPRIVDSGH